MVPSSAILLVVAVSSVICEEEKEVHLEKAIPLNVDINGQVVANLQASQGPGTKSVGAGLVVNHENGMIGGMDVTHQLDLGTKLDVGAKVPLHRGTDNHLAAIVHGSRVVGGPYDRAQSVGGGLEYKHNNGLFSNVDATHHKGIGNSYSANIGHSTNVGPGTLSVGVGAAKNTWSSGVKPHVGFNYGFRF